MAKRSRNGALARERIEHLEGALAQNIDQQCELRRQLVDKNTEILQANQRLFDWVEAKQRRDEEATVQDFIDGINRCALDDGIVISGGMIVDKHLSMYQLSIGNLRLLAGVLARRGLK
jgi:hypothetical protein